MQYLKELPAGTIWPHLIGAIKSAAENEVREYANSRASDVKRGAETPELAAAFIDKFAAGMAKALHVVGIDADVTRIADAGVREIDPGSTNTGQSVGLHTRQYSPTGCPPGTAVVKRTEWPA